MEVEIEITADDYKALNHHVVHTSPSLRRQRVIGGVVIPTVWLLVWVAVVLTRDDPSKAARALLPLLLGVLLLPLFCLRTHAKTTRAVDSLLRDGKNAGLLGHRRITLTIEGVCESGEPGESVTRWAVVERIDTTDDHAFLFTSAVSAFIVPKRAFKTNGEFEAFVGMARRLSEEGRPVIVAPT